MRRLNVYIAVLGTLILPAAGLMAAAPASAYNVSAVYRDCEVHGPLTGHYSRAELQAAYNDMPSEMVEYSACQDYIQQALLAASRPSGRHGGSTTASGGGGPNGGGGKSGGGGGNALSGGSSRTTHAGRGQKGESAGAGSVVTVDGTGIRPGSTGAGAAARSLPAALVVVLVLLTLTAVSGGALALRRRVLTRQGT